jgi:hypothetical protein
MAAPPPEPPAEPDIVVRGTRQGDRQVRDFVEALAVPSGSNQLGRAEDGVCPLSFGLAPRDAARFVQRLRRLAEAAGAPVGAKAAGPTWCSSWCPTRNGRSSIGGQSARILRRTSAREVSGLAEEPGPVSAWHIVHRKGAGRRAVAENVDGIANHLIVNHASSSRIGSNIQLEFLPPSSS